MHQIFASHHKTIYCFILKGHHLDMKVSRQTLNWTKSLKAVTQEVCTTANDLSRALIRTSVSKAQLWGNLGERKRRWGFFVCLEFFDLDSVFSIFWISAAVMVWFCLFVFLKASLSWRTGIQGFGAANGKQKCPLFPRPLPKHFPGVLQMGDVSLQAYQKCKEYLGFGKIIEEDAESGRKLEAVSTSRYFLCHSYEVFSQLLFLCNHKAAPQMGNPSLAQPGQTHCDPALGIGHVAKWNSSPPLFSPRLGGTYGIHMKGKSNHRKNVKDNTHTVIETGIQLKSARCCCAL